MKKLLMMVALVLAVATAQAQITGGIKLGGSTTDITRQDVGTFRNSTDTMKLALTNASFGLHAGAFLRIPVTKLFFLQVEPMLGSGRYQYSVDSISGSDVFNDVREGYSSFLNLDIPIMAGIQFQLPLDLKVRAQAGLVPSVVLNTQSELFEAKTYTENFDNFRWGYMLGAGVDVGAFTVDVNFNGNLSGLGESQTIPGTNTSLQFDTRPSSTVVTLGYKLFGK